MSPWQLLKNVVCILDNRRRAKVFFFSPWEGFGKQEENVKIKMQRIIWETQVQCFPLLSARLLWYVKCLVTLQHDVSKQPEAKLWKHQSL